MEMTVSEQSRLDELELAIDGGLQSFMEVGAALAEIREKRLYRSQHRSFEQYCQDRWDFTASRGRQLMAAVQAIASLPEGAPKPANAAQATALADVDPEQRAEVWERATREADDGGRPVTAADVRRAAEPVAPAREKTLGEANMDEVSPLFKEALDALKQASDAAEALSKGSAKAWLLVSGSALLKHIRDARDHVKNARPAALCPSCAGKGCGKCQSTGWITKARLEAMTGK